jgi:UDP-N-acetyl-D-mannosaminuronic acid dehydrogenase
VAPWFIVDSALEQARLIRTAREVNDAKPEWVIRRVRLEADRIKDPVIACVGIAYKADIDDLRESPALDITQALAESGCGEILVVEPNVTQLPARLLEAGARLVTLEEALQRADLVVGLVRHPSVHEDQGRGPRGEGRARCAGDVAVMRVV